MFLAVFSIIDILAGMSLLVPNFLGLYIGIIVSIKGLASLVGGIGAKDMLFSFLGMFDIIVGIALVFSFNIPWLWLLVLGKGFVSLLSSFGK